MANILVTKAKSWKDKTVGLIGTKTPKSLYFETRWGIHTLGVQFPIDVVILDSNNVVRVLKQDLKPNRFFVWNPKYFKVLELPHGTIEKERIKIGEKIEIQYTP